MPSRKKSGASMKTGRAGKTEKRKKTAKKAAPASARAAKTPKVRFAVVGLGYFAQAAVLPAFAHAGNCQLTALVSDDPLKLKTLARKYGVAKTYTYDQYQECLASNEVDAVYIALPNDLHREYTVRAAKMGVHALCEKPMAVTERECEEMIREAGEHDVRLMIAYRLHFEAANLEAVKAVQSGAIGEPRLFQSAFTMQVKDKGNIRMRADKGGGTLYDIGVYCINAARYLFRDEPYEVYACTTRKDEPRFQEVEEMASAILRFPGERLAAFTCSFGAADCAVYRLIGTEGDILLEPAYEYAMPTRMRVTSKGRTREKNFPKRDQIAPELMYFADCVLKGTEPEPSGMEGLADLRVVRALYESARMGRPVRLDPFEKRARPVPEQRRDVPPVEEPDLVHAQAPGEG